MANMIAYVLFVQAFLIHLSAVQGAPPRSRGQGRGGGGRGRGRSTTFAETNSSSPLFQYLRKLASLSPIPCRDDLATVAERHFVQTGRAAEVGVFRGTFAEANLRSWSGEYHAIDAWAFRPADAALGGAQDKNFADAAKNQANYQSTLDRMAFAGPRARAVRALSVDAAASYPDSWFDWIYLDALHTAKAVHEDLNAWWPKLRPGGLFSGDDCAPASRTML